MRAPRLPVALALVSLTAFSALAHAGQPEAATPSASRYEAPPKLRLTPKQFLLQGVSRLGLLGLRAITLPAHFWPLKQITKIIAHGEPMTGLTPQSAAQVATEIANEGGQGTVIGRLSPTYHDVWTARGAEQSFAALIERIRDARAANSNVRASMAFDPESFGYHAKGMTEAQREKLSGEAMMRVASYSKLNGVPIEMDMVGSESMPFTIKMARKIVTELKVPVRLALPARFQGSELALRQWAQLARTSGIKLGVRLVKGSYIEADTPGTINERGPLFEQYKKMVTLAMKNAEHLDVAVASQNDDMFAHAQKESARLGANFSMHVIRGVNPTLQAKMRAAGKIGAEYVSYGMDAPVFAITEMANTKIQQRKLMKKYAASLN